MPTGDAGWQRFAENVRGLDDSYERYFLELKSDVDLNTATGRAKVAKFILCAANRIKREAMRKLEGRALLVLGIGVPGGVPPFEANELDRVVQKFAGKPGPMLGPPPHPRPRQGRLGSRHRRATGARAPTNHGFSTSLPYLTVSEWSRRSARRACHNRIGYRYEPSPEVLHCRTWRLVYELFATTPVG